MPNMTIATIQVACASNGQWEVVSDGPGGERCCFTSRAAAIAAGVQQAREHDALLIIRGVEDQLTERDLQPPTDPYVP